MAIWVEKTLCRGCGACADACPGDLLTVTDGRAQLRAAQLCWGCLACAKGCPNRAIRGRLPFVLADAWASLWPEPACEGQKWVCVYPGGAREEFLLGRGMSDESSSTRR